MSGPRPLVVLGARRHVRAGALAATVLLALLAPSAAVAKNITLGSPLFGPFETTTTCGPPSCTLTNTSFSTPGALAISPVDGAVVRWRIVGGSSGSDYRARVLSPVGGVKYTGDGTSAAQTPTGAGLQSFPAALPIRAGQAVGLDIGDEAGTIGYRQEPGLASFLTWVPVLAEDDSREGAGNDQVELAFNAEVQPAPTVSGFFPASGSYRGGERVTIEGTDLTGAESVSFGTTEAREFRVESESRLTAVLPPVPPKSRSPILITTAAGTGSAPTAFTATACIVPKLVGKTFRKAKRRLRQVGCRPGRVRGPRSSGARVVTQSPKPGTALVLDAPVRLKLRR